MSNLLTWLQQLLRAPHPPHEGDTVARARGLTVRYGAIPALENVDLDLSPGEQVAVVGPNGAGKSTLLKVLAGLQRPDGGSATVHGGEPGGHICIAYLPQRSSADLTFPVSVQDVVMMGRAGRLGPLRRPGARDREIVRGALERVGLAELAQRQLRELSGGQQQRVFIARALAQEAHLLLLDEPLAGLDRDAAEAILRIFESLRGSSVSLLVALHDLGLVRERFRRVVLLNRRVVGDGAPEAVLVEEALRAAYGGHFHRIEGEGGALAVADTCCEGGKAP